MIRYLMNISYIGTNFRGVQKTVDKFKSNEYDKTTIQGCIEQGLRRLEPVNDINLIISSRTDSGVHALNSTCHVDLKKRNGGMYPPERITVVLNKIFCDNLIPIRIIYTQVVPETFHARFSAVGRTYLYRFAVAKEKLTQSNLLSFIPIEEYHRCFFIQEPDFNINQMMETSKLFLGRHDFRTFMNVTRDTKHDPKFTWRTISGLEITPSLPNCTTLNKEKSLQLYNYWDLKINGKSFLYRQVRRIVAALIGIGQNKIKQKDIYEMLTIPSKNSWCSNLNVVPPYGLYLCNVEYDLKDFK